MEKEKKFFLSSSLALEKEKNSLFIIFFPLDSRGRDVEMQSVVALPAKATGSCERGGLGKNGNLGSLSALPLASLSERIQSNTCPKQFRQRREKNTLVTSHVTLNIKGGVCDKMGDFGRKEEKKRDYNL
ncbi:MAG: hypothetical protein J6Y84_03130 [Bacteroidaceae bacterium]|nr:hypothetical protein [Bacteroidaceae bacterium]